MRKNCCFALKVIIFVCLIVILTQAMGDVLARNNEGYLYSDIIYMADDNAVDVVFIGSSHCYCTVIPQMIYDKTGVRSIVVADNMESTKSSYWAMREIADRFPQARIFVELYTASTQYDENMHHNYYTSAVRRMPEWSGYKYLGLNDINRGNDINWQYYFRFFSSRSRLFDLQYEDFSISNRDTLMECKGYDPRFDIIEDAVFEKVDLTDDQKAGIEIEAENLGYLQKMIDYSEEKNIDVTFFCSPYLTNSTEDYQYQLIENFLVQSGKTFINFNSLKDELQLLDKSYYKDKGHTNYYGAKKVTEVLCQYLENLFLEEEVRNRESNDLWEQYIGCYDKWEDFEKLSVTTEVEEYFDLLEKYKSDVLVVIAIQGNYEAFCNAIAAEKMTELYNSIGVTETNADRIYVYREDSVMSDPEAVRMNEGRSIIADFENGQASILVDGNDIAKKVDGMNVCVFNIKDMTLIDNMAIWNGTPDVIIR